MRVHFTSTMYPRTRDGWQGVFIGHIADALARRQDIELGICAPPGEYPPNSVSTTTPAEAAWLQTMVDSGGISHLVRSRRLDALFAPVRLLRILHRNYRAAGKVDVYHVNWLQTAIPLPANRTPAVITVLGNDMQMLRLPGMRAVLRHVLRSRPCILAPNAEWMVGPLSAAFGDVARIEPVTFGIAPRWYEIERSEAAPSSGRWLVVTRLTRNKLGSLFEWARPMFEGTHRRLILLGPMEQDISLPGWVDYQGPTAPAQLADHWFPRATGLISLSRHAEGRPQVMLEAMASALPIVASRIPAHEDLLGEGRTGLLCDDIAGFEQAVATLEEPGTNRRFGRQGRAWMHERMGTWDDCAGRYASLYRQLQEAGA